MKTLQVDQPYIAKVLIKVQKSSAFKVAQLVNHLPHKHENPIPCTHVESHEGDTADAPL